MKLSWENFLPIWWSFIWRAVLYGFLGGLVAGFLAGIAAALMGQPEKGALWGAAAGYVAGIAASLPALKNALQKHLTRLSSQHVTADA